MLALAPLLLVLAAPAVSAHGYLSEIIVGSNTYKGWAPFSDPYITPAPVRYTRSFADNGPVSDFTSSNITCNNGPNTPLQAKIPVPAGSDVKLQWDQWGSSHSGPVMTYLARCPSGCENFKGDTGTVWVKIDEWAYRPTETPPWGSDKLATNGANWTVKIPSSLKAGEYLLRHEILGLHVAGQKMGAQFYPSCAQIVVSGSGSTDLPTGVALPGAYQPEDPGILAQLWAINAGQVPYTAPGGAVWQG